MIDSLLELGKFGTDFDPQISDLGQMIAELDRGEESLEEGYYSPPRAVRAAERYVTDDDVKQMFYTII